MGILVLKRYEVFSAFLWEARGGENMGQCICRPIVSGRRPGQSFVAVCRLSGLKSWPWPWQRKSSNCWLLFRLPASRESISSYFFSAKNLHKNRITLNIHFAKRSAWKRASSTWFGLGAARSRSRSWALQLLCFCKPTLLMCCECVCLSGWLGLVGGSGCWAVVGVCWGSALFMCEFWANGLKCMAAYEN